MTKRQLIRAGFILAGALILNGCGRHAVDRAAITTSVASQTSKVLACDGGDVRLPVRANR